MNPMLAARNILATEEENIPGKTFADDCGDGLTSYYQRMGKWRFVWLIYTVFFFFPLSFTSITATRIAWNILLYAVLVGLTLWCMSAKRLHLRLVAAIIVVIATATAGFNSGTNVFYAYAAFFIAVTVPRATAVISFFIIVGFHFLAAAVFDLMVVYYLVPGILPMIGMTFFGIVYREAMIYAEKERKSQQQIEQLATVAERERIARDLHDVLGHTLSSIALKSQLAEKLGQMNDMQGALKEIKEVSEIASTALFEVRQAITGYKAKTLEQQLESLLERLRDKGMETEVNCDFSPLGAKAEAALMLIITEAVTNILRHSSGTKVKLSTLVDKGKFLFRIHDNGSVKYIVKGNGLNGIDERLAEIKGEARIDTDAGMCLTIIISNEFLR